MRFLALIGILNFINSMMTSILSRYKELAMLQSVGMTGRQVKQMLMIEGIGYSALGLICSLLISIVGSLDSGSNDGGRIKLFYMAFYPASCVPLCNTVSFSLPPLYLWSAITKWHRKQLWNGYALLNKIHRRETVIRKGGRFQMSQKL